MKITKLNKVVFSPTGGTQKAADALGEGLEWEKEEIFQWRHTAENSGLMNW